MATNAKEIFQAALDAADPHRRQVYLDEACGADVALRARVEALLAAHASADRFLDVPAIEQMQPTAYDGRRSPGESPDAVGTADSGRAAQDDESDDSSPSPPDLSFLQPSADSKSIGRLGHYEILQVLGQGAFGIVFKAFDPKLQRLVAIKAMNPRLAATSPPRKRFLREARSAASIKHENVVQVHNVEEHPIPYLVMEYVEGQTLLQHMEGSGPLEADEIVSLGRQMAAGLAAAHDKGLIHRDIKPGNILLEAGVEPKVKITDFGLARAADDATMTRTGTIAGTPMYMAPEQALGRPLDHRADLFSLGGVLYQMACGRPPFRGATAMAVLKRVVDDAPRPIQEIIPEVPSALCAVVMQLLAKDPADRPRSARDVAELLQRAVADRCEPGVGSTSVPAPADPAGNAPRAAAAPRRSTAVAAALVVAIGALVAVGVLNRDTSRDSAAPSTARIAAASAPGDSTPARSQDQATAGWHGWPPSAPAPARAPFDAKEVQAAWAEYLKVPVEYTSSLGLRFRLIPPGEFLYGNSEADTQILLALGAAVDEGTREKLSSEAPARRVVLTQPYYLSERELTQRQFAQIMNRNPSHFASQGAGAEHVQGLDTGDFPVESLSWQEAVEFCNTASVREKLRPCYESRPPFGAFNGNGYRLPSEAEWEFACKAGGETTFWTGDSVADFAASEWSLENSDGRTHAVGERRANPFGLYDMCGNVGEWVEDNWTAKRFADASADLVDPLHVFQADNRRTVRGGSWGGPAVLHGRSTGRSFAVAEFQASSIGVRVALSVAAVRSELERRETAAERQGVTIRRLTRGYEIVTPRYQARVAPTGLLNAVETSGTTLIRELRFGGYHNGMGWGGPVEVQVEGTSVVCRQDGEYELRYEFDDEAFTVNARVTAAAATRDGIEGKPYYVAVRVVWGDSSERVVRVNPPSELKPEFNLPATDLEAATDYRIEFSGEPSVDVRSPTSQGGFGYSTGGPREWWVGYLATDADNVFRFSLAPHPAAPP